MSDAQRVIRVSTSVCHSGDEECDNTGPAGDYKVVTTLTLLLSVVWKYWRNRKPNGFVFLAWCHWTVTVSRNVRT